VGDIGQQLEVEKTSWDRLTATVELIFNEGGRWNSSIGQTSVRVRVPVRVRP
jgi:hypothetical protein